MPAPEGAFRRQDAVLWPASGHNDYGERQVGEPVELRVRWNTTRQEAVAPDGNTVQLTAVVVVDRVIEVGGLMYLGTLEEWYGTGSAGDDSELHQIITYRETPDLKGRFIRRTVGLMKWKDTLPTG